MNNIILVYFGNINLRLKCPKLKFMILESIQKCENTPMKQIICEFGTAKEIPNFDPCLCTHIAVPVTLESEKDDETSGIYNNNITILRSSIIRICIYMT